ncbi:MAG TPA: protein translocase subunit SecD [Nocardioides sp.]|nr:protein translocase subunit SecD [Nocardioides sp.]
MAARRHRPGRTLITFFLGVAILYGLAALTGTWKPALGLDLQGGTQITLTATKTPSKANLDEARSIIDRRVNASGVSEASVTTQGNNHIIVSIPKSTSNAAQLEETAKRQAVLRFRLVACPLIDANNSPIASPCDSSAPSTLGANGRPAPAFGKVGSKPTTKPTTKPTPTPTATATPLATSSATAGSGSGTPSSDPNSAAAIIAWSAAPDAASIAEYNKLACTAQGQIVNQDGTPATMPDEPDKPLVACQGSTKYLLSRSVIEGTELTDARAEVPQNQIAWEVAITMGNDRSKAYPPNSTGAEDDFATITKKYNGTGRQFAVVLDGQVISAPTMNAYISDGRSTIQGNFTEDSAQSLATSLKYGSLPIAFEQPSTETIGPSLAGNQLHAGLLAGAIGLALVMLYCLLYYRGLGMVVVASLFVAASITYAMVLLLAKGAGFTLTLPGIAGLIIAVGITADSFVIFFERIRDEMREGKSMRVAVESGWHRARITRLAANTVSVLSALILYIFASGVVKGFGFALGLSTLVDLAVLFWFTKPMVSYLAQFKAFNSGRKWSGLSRETLGMDTPRTAGGEA